MDSTRGNPQERTASVDLTHRADEEAARAAGQTVPKIVSVPSKQDGSGIGVPSTGPKTFKMPESSLLARARMFLPKLKEANDKLEKDVAAGASVDMEARGPEESAMIQMDLSLGVFDVGAKEGAEDPGIGSTDGVAERMQQFLFGTAAASGGSDEQGKKQSAADNQRNPGTKPLITEVSGGNEHETSVS